MAALAEGETVSKKGSIMKKTIPDMRPGGLNASGAHTMAWTAELQEKFKRDEILSQSITPGSCRRCGVATDERTKGCSACRKRHWLRHRTKRETAAKA